MTSVQPVSHVYNTLTDVDYSIEPPKRNLQNPPLCIRRQNSPKPCGLWNTLSIEAQWGDMWFGLTTQCPKHHFGTVYWIDEPFSFWAYRLPNTCGPTVDPEIVDDGFDPQTSSWDLPLLCPILYFKYPSSFYPSVVSISTGIIDLLILNEGDVLRTHVDIGFFRINDCIKSGVTSIVGLRYIEIVAIVVADVSILSLRSIGSPTRKVRSQHHVQVELEPATIHAYTTISLQ